LYDEWDSQQRDKRKFFVEEDMEQRRIVVAEFENILEAEFAKAQLEAAGIDVSLSKDDVGGMMPSLQQTEGVQLLVWENELEEAQEILGEEKD
jgi:hypothetical protein